MDNRRGQITVFIIIGFIILFAVYISIVADIESIQAIPQAGVDTRPLEFHIEECLSASVVQSAVQTLEYTGGDVSATIIDKMTTQANSYIRSCLGSLSRDVYEVSGEPTIQLQLNVESLLAILDYTVLVGTGSIQKQVGPFYHRFPYKVNGIIESIVEMIDEEEIDHTMAKNVFGGRRVGGHVEGEGIFIEWQGIDDTIVFRGTDGVFRLTVVYPLDQSLRSQLCIGNTQTIQFSAQNKDTLEFVPVMRTLDCGSYTCSMGVSTGDVSLSLPVYCPSPSLFISSEGYDSMHVSVAPIVRITLQSSQIENFEDILA